MFGPNVVRGPSAFVVLCVFGLKARIHAKFWRKAVNSICVCLWEKSSDIHICHASCSCHRSSTQCCLLTVPSHQFWCLRTMRDCAISVFCSRRVPWSLLILRWKRRSSIYYQDCETDGLLSCIFFWKRPKLTLHCVWVHNLSLATFGWASPPTLGPVLEQ